MMRGSDLTLTPLPSAARKVLALTAAAVLAGCPATMPTIGGGSASPTTGATAGATSTGANERAERCDRTLGVIRIEEDTRAEWYRSYGTRLGSTTPVLKAMIMQSNCFVVVERGTGERSISDETRRARGDEARESDTRGKGQQVVADYLLKPEIVLNNKNSSGVRAGGFLPNIPLIGGVGMKNSEAGTVLTLVDIRSTVSIAAAEGYSKDSSFSIRGVGWGGGGVGAGSAYTNTDEGKMISAAFFDAYNKLVVALRQYKAQTVKGGLGQGGTLGVSGGTTEASRAVDKAKK